MSVSPRHVLRQGAVVRALLGAGLASLRRSAPAEGAEVQVPGPIRKSEVPPRAPSLVRDYVRHCGGDPGWYRGVVPPHLFPQWGFPLLGQNLTGLPYDLSKALNGGCRMELHAPLPAGEPLLLEGCLEHVDDNGRRAVLRNTLITGTASVPKALTSTVYAIVPLAKGSGGKKEKPTVPAEGVTELQRFTLERRHGRDFAVLTGDFNPIHWLPPAARLAGFRSTILHGFATLAYAIEALNATRFSNDPQRLKTIDVKFTRPLVLPAKVGLYVRDQELFVGSAPGGPAFLTGTFEEHAVHG